jgi:magnesium transporter
VRCVVDSGDRGEGSTPRSAGAGARPRRSSDWVADQVQRGRRKRVVGELAGWPPPDLADLMRELPLTRAREVFEWLPDQPAAAVLSALDPRAAASLVADESSERLVTLLDGLTIDEAVELLGQLPDGTRAAIRDRLPTDAPLALRLSYGEDTAGEVMSQRFVVVPMTWSLRRIADAIRAKAATIGPIDAVYLVDDAARLVGHLTLQDLVIHPDADRADRWLHPDTVSVGPEVDREEVLRLATERSAGTIPVVDADGVLLGAITADELTTIVREEALEDINLASGLAADSGPNDNIARMVRHRLPWLLAGLAGSTVAGIAVGAFEDALLEAAILASFIPIVMAMAGNAGIQASTVTVQGLSTGSIWQGDRWRRIGRETAAALVNSAAVGAALAVLIMLLAPVADIDRPASLAMTALLALMVAMTLAVTLGATVPIALHRAGVDPAVSTGVFIAAVNDIVGVSTFFIIATALYL